MISVLCPTRGRLLHLVEALASLATTVQDRTSYEVLLRVDDDDGTAYEMSGADVVVRGPRGAGYGQFHGFLLELARVARGEWYMIWNDDATMLTKGWDAIITRSRPGILLFGTAANRTLFPVVHIDVVRVLGHFSLNCHVDSWLEAVGTAAGVLEHAPLLATHDESVRARDGDHLEVVGPEERWENLDAERARDVAALKRWKEKREKKEGSCA